MSNFTLEPLNISAEEFLGALFEAGDKICLRIFSDKQGSIYQGQKFVTTHGHFDRMEKELHNHNALILQL